MVGAADNVLRMLEGVAEVDEMVAADVEEPRELRPNMSCAGSSVGAGGCLRLTALGIIIRVTGSS